MKKEKVEHIIGDIVAAEFVKNQKEGRKPVCRIDGILCFINRTYRGQFVEEHSVWHVEIDQINEKTMVITPVQLIKTAFENNRDIAQRMKKLATKHPKKHNKTKVFYPYKSKQEQRESNGNRSTT